MFKITDEEWAAAMDSEAYQAARSKGNEAYNRAASRYTRMARDLDNRETVRLQKLHERERQREREHKRKLDELKEKGRHAGIAADAKVIFNTICSIVRKMRKEARN